MLGAKNRMDSNLLSLPNLPTLPRLKPRSFAFLGLTAFLLSIGWATDSLAAQRAHTSKAVERVAELQVRNLIEPIIEKYCRDECKLMSVHVNVDIAAADELAPGFNDFDAKGDSALAPSSATVKLLMDEKIGPVSRSKLLDLIQQYADALEFPVKIDTQVTRFPQPIGSAAKIAELRDRVTKQVRGAVDDLFRQFCPEQCLLADYDLQTEVVNAEEAQYGAAGEFFQDSGVAIKVKTINGTILIDDALSTVEQGNILEMAKLKTSFVKNVNLSSKSMKFPRPSPELAAAAAAGRYGGGRGIAGASNTELSELKKFDSNQNTTTSATNAETQSNSSTNSNQSSQSNNSNNNSSETVGKQESFTRIEKIERVENGDAVQVELQKFKVFGLIFACSILSLLIFLALASYRPKSGGGSSTFQRVIQQIASDPVSNSAPSTFKGSIADSGTTQDERLALLGRKYEIQHFVDEMMGVFATQPKVAKYVFTRILTEDGIETTAQYIQIFGESVIIDMLRDPSLQADVTELMEYYSKNPIDIKDDEKLDLLKKLYNRTIAGKLAVMGSRSSALFDFLADMDGLQIMELIRNESVTVKAIVMTQCDPQKRLAIFSKTDEETRMKLMAELSRIDYLPRDYINNVAGALKRKRRENPKLNTEALPGSDVLLTLLERTGPDVQKTVLKSLEISAPDSARTIKNKLVSLDTLRHLRDGQLLEVVLSLKHDELLQFLKGAPDNVRMAIFAKSPKDLVSELEEELESVSVLSKEAYANIERKVINRMKVMSNDGLIHLGEVNERMLAESQASSNGIIEAGPGDSSTNDGRTTVNTAANLKKVSGW